MNRNERRKQQKKFNNYHPAIIQVAAYLDLINNPAIPSSLQIPLPFTVEIEEFLNLIGQVDLSRDFHAEDVVEPMLLENIKDEKVKQRLSDLYEDESYGSVMPIVGSILNTIYSTVINTNKQKAH